MSENTKDIVQNLDNDTEKKDVGFEVTVTLPSKGLLYHGEIPAEITLRSMTTREEKMMYGSQGDVVAKLLRNCITSPKDIDINKLLQEDLNFLLLQLREVTFGPDYVIGITCPRCNKKNDYHIDLSQFEINEIEDDFEDPYEVVLPRCKDRLEVGVLRKGDYDSLQRDVRKHSKQFNLPYAEVLYTFRAARSIKKINGKPVDQIDARSYVDNLQAMDMRKLWTELNKVNFGVVSKATVTCPDCGEVWEVTVPMTSEFFHPTIE
jgi:hypothetical protein